MPEVVLRVPASPDHVRTVRQVAVATARRAGLPEDRLEDLRLAVGEVAARAVRRCAIAAEAGTAILLEICIDPDRLLIRLVDAVPDPAPVPPTAPVAAGAAKYDRARRLEELAHAEDVALGMAEGLADRFRVGVGPGGGAGLVELAWSLPA